MSYGGHLIFEHEDPQGLIRVLELGEKRVLSFGPGNEQSAGVKGAPEVLLFDYTQAMLLALLWSPQPRRVLVLGLGAGSLVSCLHHHFKSKIDAVEQHPVVIDVAQRFFGLPHSKRLKLHRTEAGAYLTTTSQKYDLILSDLYVSTGMHEQQTRSAFLRTCAEHLKPEGVFVMNCWRDTAEEHAHRLTQMTQSFAHVGSCSTPDQNWLVFGAHGPLEVTPVQQQRAKAFTKQLGFSLQKYLKRWRSHHVS